MCYFDIIDVCVFIDLPLRFFFVFSNEGHTIAENLLYEIFTSQYTKSLPIIDQNHMQFDEPHKFEAFY